MRPRALSLLLALVGSACGGEESDGLPPPDNCVPPNRRLADRCLEPGVQDDGCPAGALGLEDGTCQPAGVPPELCGDGFVPDDAMGCEPILPSEPCPRGQMAVPGESTCRAVMPCGAGKWGDIPIDATTVYVDAAYLGLDSDGSSDKPFATISDAVAAAASDSVIAVAAGSYVEDVVIHHKKVRLWGKCPSEVELVGTGTDLAALFIREAAGGTEVRGLAVRGALLGLVVSGAEDVLIERVWVHDTLDRGINVESVLGATSITVRDSLVEETQDAGVLVAGSEATLDGVVIRGTQPRASDQRQGWGIAVQLACTAAGCDPLARSTALVRSSLVEKNHDLGVLIAASDATFEGVVVRGTLPNAKDQNFGRGFSIQPACLGASCDTSARSTTLVRASLVENNHDNGVFVMGSDATLEGLLVRGTQPTASNQRTGRGVNIQLSCFAGSCEPAARSSALVRGSRIAQNHEVGVYVSGADATLEGVLVEDTLAREADGLVGDGVSVSGQDAPATASVTSSRIEANARAGLLNFGSSVALGASALVCNAFNLEGEKHGEQAFTFEDVGGNACGCPDPIGACKAQSAGLEPPGPLTDNPSSD